MKVINFIEVKNLFLRKLLLFFFALSIMNCSKSEIEGYYFDENKKRIFEFNTSNLLIYNIADSTKLTYAFKINNDKLILNDGIESFKLNYIFENDSLWLLSGYQNLLDNNDIKLVKCKINDNLDQKILTLNYWHIFNNKTDFWLKFINDDNMTFGNAYLKEENHNIEFDHSFSFDSHLYFDKFRIYSIGSSFLNFHGYLLSNIDKDSLVLVDLYNFKEIRFNNYISKTDTNLYGKWANTNINNKGLMVFSDDGRFYFGDTVIFQKNKKFKRKVKEYFNYFYQDTISRTNSVGKESFGKPQIPFEIGLNTKHLIFDKPLDQVLEIKKLTKDSLIIKNHTIGEKLLMKYIRVED